MLQSVSISSKNQVTIPQVFAKSLKLKRGQRLIMERVGNSLVVTPADELVRQLSGSIRTHKPISNNEMERMIEIAKQRQFTTRHSV